MVRKGKQPINIYHFCTLQFATHFSRNHSLQTSDLVRNPSPLFSFPTKSFNPKGLKSGTQIIEGNQKSLAYSAFSYLA